MPSQLCLGQSPFFCFVLTYTPVPLLFALQITLVGFSNAGTVEAGAGAGGEGVKRKRSDDMAALEADLAPEPQAGMAQSPPLSAVPICFSSPHLYQHMPSP